MKDALAEKLWRLGMEIRHHASLSWRGELWYQVGVLLCRISFRLEFGKALKSKPCPILTKVYFGRWYDNDGDEHVSIVKY